MSKQINNLNNSLKKQLHLNEKQDKTDNNLETKDKTIIGAINEIQNSYATAEYVDVNLKKTSGDLTNLQTNNKTNLVGAINELFQSANNGKELIATAIGEPLNSSDTFSAMSNDINSLLSTFKTNMMNNGITVESNDRFKQLIDKIATLADNEGKGVQFASRTVLPSEIKTGSFTYYSTNTSYNGTNMYYLTINDLKFTPSVILITGSHVYRSETRMTYGVFDIINNMPYYVICGGGNLNLADAKNLSGTIKGAGCYDMTVSNSMDFPLGFALNNSYPPTLNNFTWYAFGVGEEDTTLRDSLASILEDEGVSVTEEDDMASLISKVDSEFTNKNNTIQTNRDKLYNLMLDGGYKVTNDMTLDALLEMIKLSGIENNDIKCIRFGGTCTEATFLGNMLILKENGKLYGCGGNQFGQLGLGDTETTKTYLMHITDNVKEVYSGYSHTFIIKNDGSLWACGHNNMGQLGLGDTTNRSTFTQVTTNINNDVKEVACGYLCTFIIKNDGSIWACGYNSNGQLGLNDTTTRNTFTQVTTNINNDVKEVACGYSHTFIIKNDGSLWSCGYNGYGQLGLGDTNTYKVFTQVTTNINNDIKQVECGTYHTFIVKNDGSLWSCGYNDNGQLGLGDNAGPSKNIFTQVTTNINNDVKQVSSYCCYHAMIIKNDGSLWTCGRNSGGQLGLGNNAGPSRNTFTKVTTNINNDVKQVECGAQESVILKNDGTVWVCGYSSYIGLGYTSQTAVTTFTKIPEGFTY